MKKKHYESYEGWDAQAAMYDAREERKYETSIWKLMLIIFSVTLLVTAVLHAGDLKLYFNGRSFEAEYDKQYKTAEFKNENGQRELLYITKPYAHTKADKVVLFYLGDDIKTAQPMTSPLFWVCSYGLSLGMVSLSAFRIWKSYRKRK